MQGKKNKQSHSIRARANKPKEQEQDSIQRIHENLIYNKCDTTNLWRKERRMLGKLAHYMENKTGSLPGDIQSCPA